MKATLFFDFSLFHVKRFYISPHRIVKKLAGAAPVPVALAA